LSGSLGKEMLYHWATSADLSIKERRFKSA